MPVKADTSAILEELSKAAVKPAAFLVVCIDRVRRERVLGQVLKSFFGAEAARVPLKRQKAGEMNLHDLNALWDEISSPSLFSAAQLFVLDEIEDFGAEAARRLLDYLHRLPAGVFLIVTAGKLPSNSVLRKHFSSARQIVELSDLEGQELRRWLKEELKQAGINRISEAAVNSLVRIASESPDRLSRLVQHAALYVNGEELKNEDLEALFIERFEPSEFELVEALGHADRARPEILLEQILRSGKSPFALLGMLSKIFSNYLQMRQYLDDGIRPPDVQLRMGMNSWVFGRYHSAASRYDTARIKMLQAAVLRADSRLKNKNLGPQAVISDLINVLAV